MNPSITRYIAIVSTVILFLAQGGSAQTREFATTGCAEIAGAISFSSYTGVHNGVSSSTSISMFNFSPQFAYFVKDGLELGLSPGVSYLFWPQGVTALSGGGSSETIFQYFITFGYNFTLRTSEGSPGSVFPFIEAHVGRTSISSDGEDESGLSWGLRGGVKVVPTDHLLVSIGASYHMITLDPPDAPSRNGFNFFSIGVGIGGYF